MGRPRRRRTPARVKERRLRPAVDHAIIDRGEQKRRTGMERKFLLLLVPLLAAAFVTTDFGASLTEPSVAVAKKKKRQGVFQGLFRPRDQHPEMSTPLRVIPPRTSSRELSNKRRPQASGTRTLCVRACDGYYFPISYSATRKRFKIDEAVCKAMYGGAEANLYVHDNGSPPDTAVSLKGKPLAREPNAFAFRQTFNEACHAQLTHGLKRFAAAFEAGAEQESAALAEDRTATRLSPVPVPRVAAGTDPETIANRAGGFTTAQVRSSNDSTVAAASMRKLGAAYYYADSVLIENLRDAPRRELEFTLVDAARADQRD
jgi:hypothetical protein